MTESTENVAAIDILEDIAALARKLAEKEPFRSAGGPEALQAFATHLEDMVTIPGQTALAERPPSVLPSERGARRAPDVASQKSARTWRA